MDGVEVVMVSLAVHVELGVAGATVVVSVAVPFGVFDGVDEVEVVMVSLAVHVELGSHSKSEFGK